jgi:hypothetical protein
MDNIYIIDDIISLLEISELNTELLADFAREYDKALEPIPVNNRAARRSKGKMQDASRWKRSNMKRRFYE